MELGGLISISQGLSNKSLSWAESTQFLVLVLTYLGSILILSSHLRLGLPKSLFPLDLSVKLLKALPPSIMATWPAHQKILDLITQFMTKTIAKTIISFLFYYLQDKTIFISSLVRAMSSDY